MNFERATAPGAEDHSPDAWGARWQVAQSRNSGSGRGGRVLRRSANPPGLLPTADLHRPAGGDLLVAEPAATDQKYLQHGGVHWPQIQRVLPAAPPRPWLRDGRAQRGTAGRGLVRSKATTTEQAGPVAVRSTKSTGSRTTYHQLTDPSGTYIRSTESASCPARQPPCTWMLGSHRCMPV